MSFYFSSHVGMLDLKTCQRIINLKFINFAFSRSLCFGLKFHYSCIDFFLGRQFSFINEGMKTSASKKIAKKFHPSFFLSFFLSFSLVEIFFTTRIYNENEENIFLFCCCYFWLYDLQMKI